MIATGLTFLFGVLVTTLLAILIAPVVWRKAQSLAKRDYEATIPASANEIRAEFDRVRAEAAMSVRRQEILAAKAQEKSARTQAELGRGTVENVELLKRARGLGETIAQRDGDLADLAKELAGKSAEAERLAGELAASRREAALSADELEALASRFQDLGEIAEERKIQLIAAEARLDGFSDTGRSAERSQRESQAMIDRLRGELATAVRLEAEQKAAALQIGLKLEAQTAALADRDEEIAGLKDRLAASIPLVGAASGNRLVLPAPAAALPKDRPVRAGSAGQRLRAALDRKNGVAEAPASTAEISEAISDLAARVIRMTSLAEGPASPLVSMLKTETPAGQNAPVSLAERVALLAEAERGTKPLAAQPGRPRAE